MRITPKLLSPAALRAVVELHFDDESKTCNIVPVGDGDE